MHNIVHAHNQTNVHICLFICRYTAPSWMSTYSYAGQYLWSAHIHFGGTYWYLSLNVWPSGAQNFPCHLQCDKSKILIICLLMYLCCIYLIHTALCVSGYDRFSTNYIRSLHIYHLKLTNTDQQHLSYNFFHFGV